MRARHRRFSSTSIGRSDPARSSSLSVVRRVGGRLLLLHAFTALMLVMGTFAPYLSTGVAAAAAPMPTTNVEMTLNAQDPDQPPPVPRPNNVIVTGDFQTAVGCNDNNDPNCGATSLSPNDDGTWSGSFQIPTGSYSFNIVVQTDQGTVTLGRNGQPDAKAINLDVPDGAIGVFFSYNRYTGEIVAAPYSNQVDVQIDGGSSFTLAPTADGGWDGYVDAGQGSHQGQFFVNGEAFGDPFDIDGGQSGRVHIVIDSGGNVQTVEAVNPATLTITKTDQDGNIQAGSCFSVYTRNGVAGQECDASDGEDGSTTIQFPNGVPSGNLTLAESFVPNGQGEVDNQGVDLSNGDNQVQVTAGGGGSQGETPEGEVTPEEGETPNTRVAEGNDLSLQAVDQDSGDALPGACYTVDDGAEQCDDDGDAIVTISGVETGSHTLTNTKAPDGYQELGSFEFDMPEGGAQYQVPFTAAEQQAETGTLLVHIRDENDNPLSGACVNLTPRSGNDGSASRVCDSDDGNDDGEVTFNDVTSGRWRVEQESALDGYNAPNPRNVTVRAGETTETTLTSESAGASTGSIAATTIDENGNELPEVCYDLSEFGQQCDGTDDDNVMTQDEVPPGDYTVTVIAPDGYDIVGDATQQVSVQAGETATVQFQVQTAQPEDTPTPEETPTPEAAETGSLHVVVQDSDGFGLLGACVDYSGPSNGSVCDNDGTDTDGDDGSILIEGLEPGDYTVNAQAVQGYQTPEAQSVTIDAGQQADVTVVLSTEPQTGTLVINKQDPDGNPLPGACFTVDNGPEVCDNGDGDADPTDGVIQINDLEAGRPVLRETQAPDGYEANRPRLRVDITAGETTTVDVQNNPLATPTPTPVPTGTLIARTNDDAGNPIGGVCYDVSSFGQVCDEDGDGDMQLPDSPAGDYTVQQVSVPDGYDLDPDSQQQTLAGGATIEFDFVSPRQAGSIVITKTDGQNPLGGACFTVDDGNEVCDNRDGDADNNDGTITIENIDAGQHQVAESQTPDGYNGAESQTVDVQPGQAATVTFVNTQQTGSIRVTVTDGQNPVADACVSVDGGDAVCDNDDNDQDSTDGVIEIAGITPGEHTVTLDSKIQGLGDGGEQQVQVQSGETADVTLTLTPEAGAILITKTDGENALGGACFTVDGGDPICDNGDGDNDDNDGSILIANVEPGTHDVTESQVPDGYSGADAQSVDVPAGGTGELTFVNTALPTATSEPTETPTEEPSATPTEEPTETPTEEATETPTEEATEAPTETPTEAATETPTETPTQEAVATETETPTETPTEEVTSTETPVEEGTPTEEPVAETGSLVIISADENGDPLTGTCFSVDGPASYTACDNGEGDADDADGSIRIAEVEVGDYTITETQSPDGYLPADAQDVTISANEEAQVQFSAQLVPAPEPTATPEANTGSLAIGLANENGEPLTGGCFTVSGPTDAGPLCDNAEGDGDDADGAILIGDLLEGAYTVSQTSAPDGYTPASDQQVNVTAGDQPATVEFANQPTPPQTGSVRISSIATGGDVAGGGCYTVGSTAVCDNGSGDSDAAPGVILVVGIVVGQYDVTETDAPEGYAQNTTVESVEITADTESAVEFTHDPAAPETGGVTFNLRDPDGKPVVGGCVTVSANGNGENGTEYCDGGPDDQNPADGVLELKLETGSYSAQQSELPATPDSASTGATRAMTNFLQGDPAGLPAGLSLDEKTFTVRANVVIIVIIIIIIVLPEDGDLVIIKRADDTNQLQKGACFTITGPGGDIDVCDNDAVDQNGSNGIIRVDELAFGDYEVKETTAPEGYQLAPVRDVTIGYGVRTITIRDEPVTETTGNLTILKKDENGDPLPGSCFELRQNNVVVYAEVCDDTGGPANNNGTIRFLDIEAGTYRLRETVQPSADYQPAPDQTVKVVPGATKTYQVVNTLKPGDILIVKLDDEGNGPLAGACFGLERGSGIEYEVCDQEPEDGDFEEGIILFRNIPAGDWTLIELQAPAGFQPGDDQEITVLPGKTLNLQIENQPEPPQPKGNFKVFKVNSKNQALPGACFSLKQGNVTIVPARCDNADGNNDGTINFIGVNAGTYTLHETKKPSAQYQPVPDVQVTIVANTTKTTKVVNQLRTGRILVKKVNQQGQPLQGACFDLSPGGNGPKCADANGQIIFDGLDSTKVYKLTETKAPIGYQVAPPKTNIAVDPGLTTTVTIVDKKTPPPPDTGAIKVIKFFCPAGKTGENTVTYDSSDPGPKKLAQTANCKKGNAEFVLEKSNGSGDPIQFKTGQDGEYQAALQKGEYDLTEVKTDTTVQVEIFAGQQTTVIVLNFVKPVQPKPATIKIEKYTCDAGFGGSYYGDFVDNCVSPGNLTNGVTFRVSGEAAQKRVTGDGNIKGATSFTQLPAGGYTLEEEPPSGASTVYAFCGYDINQPDYKSVDEDISFNLDNGDVLTCRFFNIPDDLTDSTGAIKVTKYVCDLPGNKRPANFDWFANCSVETDGVKFTLSVQQAGKFLPKSAGVTNVDGIINFSNLKPGTYQLKEVGADWCHAESDNVNAQGNLIVRAGQRTSVWIFNCVPTKNPPNTGAGTTAPPQADSATTSLSSLPADTTADTTLMMMTVLPLLGLALYGLRRKGRQPYRQAA